MHMDWVCLLVEEFAMGCQLRTVFNGTIALALCFLMSWLCWQHLLVLIVVASLALSVFGFYRRGLRRLEQTMWRKRKDSESRLLPGRRTRRRRSNVYAFPAREFPPAVGADFGEGLDAGLIP